LIKVLEGTNDVAGLLSDESEDIGTDIVTAEGVEVSGFQLASIVAISE